VSESDNGGETDSVNETATFSEWGPFNDGSCYTGTFSMATSDSEGGTVTDGDTGGTASTTDGFSSSLTGGDSFTYHSSGSSSDGTATMTVVEGDYTT
jgi:hypothetical protein